MLSFKQRFRARAASSRSDLACGFVAWQGGFVVRQLSSGVGVVPHAVLRGSDVVAVKFQLAHSGVAGGGQGTCS